MFTKTILNTENVFSNTIVKFENVTKGRLGAVLVDNVDVIPIVRTTTVYQDPVQEFKPVHREIIKKLGHPVNNALIEIYDDRYRKMRYHSDQALDLEEDSYICIFSCYENPSLGGFRTLCITNKSTNEKTKIVLEHNSVVAFSTSANKNTPAQNYSRQLSR